MIQVEDIKPGMYVLAKLKSFDPWPGVIVPYNLVPTRVISKAKAAARKDTEVFVYFPDEGNFGWCGPNKMTLLTEESVLAEFYDENGDYVEPLSGKGKKHKRPDRQPAIEKFLAFCKDDEATRIRNLFIECKIIKKSDELELSSPFKSKDVKSIAKGSAVTKKRVKEEEDEDKTTKKFKNIKEESIEYTQEEKISKAQRFRVKLQKGLLQRKDEPSIEDLHNCSNVLKELEDFSKHINTDILKTSKLQKVLRAILKLDNLKNPENLAFHVRCEELLIDWRDYISELRMEKEKEGTRSTETPNSSILGTNGTNGYETIKTEN